LNKEANYIEENNSQNDSEIEKEKDLIINNIDVTQNELELPNIDNDFATNNEELKEVNLNNYIESIDDTDTQSVEENTEIPTTTEIENNIESINNEVEDTKVESVELETANINEENNLIGLNIDNLINDLKSVQVEDISNKENVSSIETQNQLPDINALADELNNIEVEGIKPLLPPKEDELKEEANVVENKSPIKNDYLITSYEPSNISIEEAQQKIEDIPFDINSINVEQKIDEPNENEKSDDFVPPRFEENEMNVEIQPEQNTELYINPNIDNMELPKMPEIPVVLPKKEERIMDIEDTIRLTKSQIEEQKQEINVNPIPSNENVTQSVMPQEQKKSNVPMILLFVGMVVLGVVVAVVVSYVFGI